MDLILGLVIGMIIGLLINWVLSPLIDHRDSSVLQQTILSLQERIEHLELAQGSGAITTIVVREKDDFARITGIDAPMVHHLNEAGIYTFEQLAGIEPARLCLLVQIPETRSAEAQGWIEAARNLAARQED